MAIICSHCGSALPTTSASEPTHWHNGMGQVLTAAQKDAQDKVVASRFDQPLYAHPAPSEPVSDGLVRFDGVTMTPAAAVNRLAESASALTAAEARAAEAEKELDIARQIVRDVHWMAVRYADGRKSYAPGMLNDALRKAYDAGWLKYDRPVSMQELDPQYAREGAKTDLGDLFEAAEAKIDELEHRSLAEGWRPIETAPKDGTVILVANEEGAIFTAWWVDDKDSIVGTDTGGPGWVDGTTNGYDDLQTYTPTHWRYLPQPPEAK